MGAAIESIEHRRRRALAKLKKRAQEARDDPNVFIEFMGQVRGGKRARQHPVHREWQALWSGSEDITEGRDRCHATEYKQGNGRRTILLAPVGHGKTTQLVWRLLWEMGRKPDVTISIIGITEEHPIDLIGLLKAEIESNTRLRLVFPNLKKNTVQPKWAAKSFNIQRGMTSATPTVKAYGIGGKILGKRVDIIVCDDILNIENTLTVRQREKVHDWVSSEVLSRLLPPTPEDPGARVWMIGHIWHKQDAMQRLKKLKTWTYARYECLIPEDPDGKACGVDIDKAANDERYRPLIPTIMNRAGIAEKAGELTRRRRPLMLLNRIPPDQFGRFRESWFDAMLARGRGLQFVDKWSGSMTFTGVDLGHDASDGHHKTVMWTAAVLPDGSRRVLDVRSGLWDGPEILDQIREVHRRFGSIIAVESNGAQRYIHQFADRLDVLPIKDHHTGMNKHDLSFGLESMGHEFEAAAWILPCDDNLVPHVEVAEGIAGALDYNPADPVAHTSDYLMAWWICREAIRLSPAAEGMEMPTDDDGGDYNMMAR